MENIIVTIFGFAFLIGMFIMSIFLIWHFKRQILIVTAVIASIVVICFVMYHIAIFILSFCDGDDFTEFALVLLFIAIGIGVWGRINSKK